MVLLIRKKIISASTNGNMMPSNCKDESQSLSLETFPLQKEGRRNALLFC